MAKEAADGCQEAHWSMWNDATWQEGELRRLLSGRLLSRSYCTRPHLHCLRCSMLELSLEKQRSAQSELEANREGGLSSWRLRTHYWPRRDSDDGSATNPLLLPQSLLGRPSSQCAKSHRFHILMNIVRIRNWVAFSPHSARSCVLLGLVSRDTCALLPRLPQMSCSLGAPRPRPRLQRTNHSTRKQGDRFIGNANA